jgi:hypothetical protein
VLLFWEHQDLHPRPLWVGELQVYPSLFVLTRLRHLSWHDLLTLPFELRD